MKSQTSRFVEFLGICGLTILLSAFFLTLFGVVDLRVINSIDTHPLLNFIGSFALMSINTFALIMFCTSKVKITHSIILAVLCCGSSIFVPIKFVTLTTTIVSSVYTLLITKPNKIFILWFWGLVLPYQYISNIVKFHYFSIEYNNVNFYFLLLYSVDLFIYYIFIERSKRIYVGLASVDTWFSWFLIKQKLKSIFDEHDYSKIQCPVDYTKAQRKVYYAVCFGTFTLQLIVVLIIGFINNMVIELLVILPMFFISREILKQSWHSNKLWICSVATFSGFYILTKITPPFEISLFLVVATTGVFVWLLHYVGIKAEKLEKLEHKYNDDFTNYGFTPETARIAYDWKITGLNEAELLQKYPHLSREALAKRKNRINKKLKSANVT